MKSQKEKEIQEKLKRKQFLRTVGKIQDKLDAQGDWLCSEIIKMQDDNKTNKDPIYRKYLKALQLNEQYLVKAKDFVLEYNLYENKFELCEAQNGLMSIIHNMQVSFRNSKLRKKMKKIAADFQSSMMDLEEATEELDDMLEDASPVNDVTGFTDKDEKSLIPRINKYRVDHGLTIEDDIPNNMIDLEDDTEVY